MNEKEKYPKSLRIEFTQEDLFLVKFLLEQELEKDYHEILDEHYWPKLFTLLNYINAKLGIKKEWW